MSSRTAQVAQMNEADQKCIHSAGSWQEMGHSPNGPFDGRLLKGLFTGVWGDWREIKRTSVVP